MIKVFDGDKINIDGITYDGGTPSYIAHEHRENVNTHGSFSLYDPQKKYGGHKRIIFVNMPIDFEVFLAAINVLVRIKEHYPLSPIYVNCRSEYKCLLPSGIKFQENTDPIRGQDIYRSYDLFIPDDKFHILSMNYKKYSYEVILLMLNGLFDVVMDMGNYKSKSIYKSKPQKKVVIFKCADTGKEVWSALADKFDYSSCEVIRIDEIKYDSKSIKKYLDLLKSSVYAIFCGDTKLITLAAYTGINSYCILQSNGYSKEAKLRDFPNIKGREIASKQDLEGLLGKLYKSIDSKLSLAIIVPDSTKIDIKKKSHTKSKKKKKKGINGDS